MQHGEVAHLLVFEHIYGISLEGSIDSYPEHSDADETRINLPFYNTMPSHFKIVVRIMSFQILYPQGITVLQTGRIRETRMRRSFFTGSQR